MYSKLKEDQQMKSKEKNTKVFDSTIIKFIIVGVVNTVVGWVAMFLSLWLLTKMGANHTISYWIPSGVNIVVGSIVSYILNKHFTFQSNTTGKEDIGKFIINILICYVVAYGIAQPIAKLIFKHAGVMVLKIISLLSGSILFTIINYFGQRFWVFKEDKK